MLAHFAFVFVTLLSVNAATRLLAQAPQEKADTAVIDKIKEEGLKRSQVMETISFLTDVHGPRLTASPQTRIAAEWTKDRLAKWGLENVHLEPWGPFGRGWTLEALHRQHDRSRRSTPLIAYPKAWSPSTPKTIRGKPVFLDAAKEEDLEKYRGKLHRAIVLISPPREVKALFEAAGPPAERRRNAGPGQRRNARSSRVTPSNAAPDECPDAARRAGAAPGTPFGARAEQRAAFALQNRKWQMTYDEGAAVVLEPGRGDGGTLFVGSVTMPTRSQLQFARQSLRRGQRKRPTERCQRSSAESSGNPSSRGPRPWQKDAPEIVPQVVLAVEHYNRIVRMLQKDAPVQLEIDIASRYHADDLMSFNVVAEIPGGDLKDEFVMLGGHFDSWHSGTGATDNAVGCGVALEAVRICKSLGIKPRRTIRLALWTGEEQGLLGSKAYVTDHFGRAITPPQQRSGAAAAGRDSAAVQPAASKPNGTSRRSAGHQRRRARRSTS